jgi:hypothetical protein
VLLPWCAFVSVQLADGVNVAFGSTETITVTVE